MQIFFVIIVCTLCSGILNADIASTTASPNNIMLYKTELFEDLNSGSIVAGNFDQATEISIAQTQLKLAEAYMNGGDRKLALILGILARKTMQRALNNPYDSAMIPIYSILVELYNSNVDTDLPNQDQADATKAKLYREAIDHIHSK